MSTSEKYRRAYRDTMDAMEREARERHKRDEPATWQDWLAVALMLAMFTAGYFFALHDPWLIADTVARHLR